MQGRREEGEREMAESSDRQVNGRTDWVSSRAWQGVQAKRSALL